MEQDRAVKLIKPPAPAVPNFHPSPTMQVHFGNGKVIAMNRRERRHQHLYGDQLTRQRR